jgi:hypothetical protein
MLSRFYPGLKPSSRKQLRYLWCTNSRRFGRRRSPFEARIQAVRREYMAAILGLGTYCTPGLSTPEIAIGGHAAETDNASGPISISMGISKYPGSYALSSRAKPKSIPCCCRSRK